MDKLNNMICELLKESNTPLTRNEIERMINHSKASTDLAIRRLLDQEKIIAIGSNRNRRYGIKEKQELYKKTSNVHDFTTIDNAADLITYLSDPARLKNTKMLYHYTNIGAVINIISNKYWYIGSPKKMNDGLELKFGLDASDNMFFSSFMVEQQESIAMWSMYAQPWEDGVMISIPLKEYRRWIKDIDKIYEADPNTKQINWENYTNCSRFQVSLIRVAYIVGDMFGKIEEIMCGQNRNKNFRSVNNAALLGYIKDDAWSYEKEVRLRVDLYEKVNYQGIAIEVPDYIIDSMVITQGPRFKEDLEKRVEEEIRKKFQTNRSIFYNKLKNIPCDGCLFKKSS